MTGPGNPSVVHSSEKRPHVLVPVQDAEAEEKNSLKTRAGMDFAKVLLHASSWLYAIYNVFEMCSWTDS